MKNTFLIVVAVLFISCVNERELQLPQIDNAKINEITDVSAAYLFYDETKTDSTDLNRKNLISTTNWLVNVDKRLTLKQAIPHIKFLQSKKKSSSHKNEKAKNYFTCYDLSKNNLGFLEFTEINYHYSFQDLYERKDIELSTPNHETLIQVINLDSIRIHFPEFANPNFTDEISSNKNDLLNDLTKIKDKTNIVLYSSFLSNLKFQDYITFQNIIRKLEVDGIKISNHEFIIDSM